MHFGRPGFLFFYNVVSLEVAYKFYTK